MHFRNAPCVMKVIRRHGGLRLQAGVPRGSSPERVGSAVDHRRNSRKPEGRIFVEKSLQFFRNALIQGVPRQGVREGVHGLEIVVRRRKTGTRNEEGENRT